MSEGEISTSPLIAKAAVDPQQISDLQTKIKTMSQEIDGLQILAATRKRPWYKDTSTAISITALLFSFGTTLVSYHRTQQQDILASRQELRGMLQRLSAIPRENIEAAQKYASDQFAAESVRRFLTAELVALAQQSAEIATSLPKDKVSAIEFYEIGTAMQEANNPTNAKELFERSRDTAEKAKDFSSELGASRSIAGLQFVLGKPGEGRIEYQKSLNIFSEYPDFDENMRLQTNAYTELAWAASEAYIKNLPAAQAHLDAAQKLADANPGDPDSIEISSMVATQRKLLSSPNPPAPASPMPPALGAKPQ